MRITPQKLHNWAREVARQIARQEDVLTVYLVGSLLSNAPLLGETTDVDLVCIWNQRPPFPHELQQPRPGILIDLRHYPREAFEPARRVRTDPWLGPEVFVARTLYDPRHFFDRVQATVRSHFHDPEVALHRAAHLLAQSREAWMRLPTLQETVLFVDGVLDIVFRSAHVPATLRGYTLPPRRFLWALNTLSRIFGHTDWMAAVLQLLGAPQAPLEVWGQWLALWERDFDRALATQPVRHPVLHPGRKHYYLAGIQALLQGETPAFALFPFLWTWTQAAARLTPDQREDWRAVIHTLGLDRRDPVTEALDQWLDGMENFLEAWAQEHGLEVPLAL